MNVRNDSMIEIGGKHETRVSLLFLTVDFKMQNALLVHFPILMYNLQTLF